MVHAGGSEGLRLWVDTPPASAGTLMALGTTLPGPVAALEGRGPPLAETLPPCFGDEAPHLGLRPLRTLLVHDDEDPGQARAEGIPGRRARLTGPAASVLLGRVPRGHRAPSLRSGGCQAVWEGSHRRSGVLGHAGREGRIHTCCLRAGALGASFTCSNGRAGLGRQMCSHRNGLEATRLTPPHPPPELAPRLAHRRGFRPARFTRQGPPVGSPRRDHSLTWSKVTAPASPGPLDP